MAKHKNKKDLTDREKWNQIFNALVQMLRTQQGQLESLAKERKFLEDRIKFQYDRWLSDVDLLKGQLSQMKSGFKAQEMGRKVESAKSDLLMDFKRREASFYKHKLEDVESDLSDFREIVDHLSRKLSEQEDVLKINNNNLDEHRRVKLLESEVQKLKCEKEKLTLEKNSDVSALLSEKKFVWNQYNIMESNLKDQLQQKSAEVELANKKLWSLLGDVEELRSSNSAKDDALAGLKSDLAKLQSESSKKNEEISRLSWELEQLRKSRSDSITPVLRSCRTGGGKNGLATNVKLVTVKKESDTSRPSEKGNRSLRRKAVEVITIDDSPKLFTSTFKLPKLKSASQQL